MSNETNCCEKRCKSLLDRDIFAKLPELYIKGKTKKPSILGLVCSSIYLNVYIPLLLYKIVQMLRRVDFTFYDSYEYNDFPSIKLTNEIFYGGFSMGGIIDETLYYPRAIFHSGVKEAGVWNYNIRELELETCKLEKFGSKYRELFKNQPLSNLYCLKDVDFTLEGNANLDRFSYIRIKVYPCVNSARDGRQCKDHSSIYNFFASNTLEFKMQDNLLTPDSFNNPVVPQKKDIYSPVFLDVYQKLYSHIQIVYVDTDVDLTGLRFLTKKNRIEQYLKYESSMLIAAPGTDQILNTGGAACEVTMQLDAKVLTKKRKYATLLDALGAVGGLIGFFSSFLNFICSLTRETLYYESLVNDLFSFDLGRKRILIKNKNDKDNDTKKNENARKTNSLSELQQNNEEIYSKESIKEENLVLDSKDNSDKLNLNNKNNNDEKNNNINEQAQILNSNNYEINNFMKSDTKLNTTNKKTNKIIDNLNISSCCFRCINKNKNINKYLLEEGKKIFSEKLDIINLFNKLLIVEKLQNSFNNDEKYIEMSDECQHDIDNFIKNM